LPCSAARRHVEGLSALLALMAGYGAADAAGKMALQAAFAKRAVPLEVAGHRRWRRPGAGRGGGGDDARG
ncbi:hypothetical protein, partial [Myxococcus vastator]|uniref:hypothetical protein n=1 Tax=Myxococcus vastator TaxID=2709664 RepID=UPI0019686F47